MAFAVKVKKISKLLFEIPDGVYRDIDAKVRGLCVVYRDVWRSGHDAGLLRRHPEKLIKRRRLTLSRNRQFKPVLVVSVAGRGL